MDCVLRMIRRVEDLSVNDGRRENVESWLRAVGSEYLGILADTARARLDCLASFDTVRTWQL